MKLVDVNILVYAYWEGAPDHRRYRRWLGQLMLGEEAYAISDFVLSGFVRIASNPRLLSPPGTIDEVLSFCHNVREQPNCVRISPGPRHWGIFERLCRQAGAKGNLVTDAYLAALAIEWGCELITTDRDFARFEGLRWRHPLAG